MRGGHGGAVEEGVVARLYSQRGCGAELAQQGCTVGVGDTGGRDCRRDAAERAVQHAGLVVVDHCADTAAGLAVKYLVGEADIAARDQAHLASCRSTGSFCGAAIGQRTGGGRLRAVFHRGGLDSAAGHSQRGGEAGAGGHGGEDADTGAGELNLIRLLGEVGDDFIAVDGGHGYDGIVGGRVGVAGVAVVTGCGNGQHAVIGIGRGECLVLGAGLQRTAEAHVDDIGAVGYTGVQCTDEGGGVGPAIDIEHLDDMQVDVGIGHHADHADAVVHRRNGAGHMGAVVDVVLEPVAGAAGIAGAGDGIAGQVFVPEVVAGIDDTHGAVTGHAVADLVGLHHRNAVGHGLRERVALHIGFHILDVGVVLHCLQRAGRQVCGEGVVFIECQCTAAPVFLHLRFNGGAFSILEFNDIAIVRSTGLCGHCQRDRTGREQRKGFLHV